jgi:hypothetical protein
LAAEIMIDVDQSNAPITQLEALVLVDAFIQDDHAGMGLSLSLPAMRMRVGDYRLLFEVEGAVVMVYRILHRKDAYQ